MKIEIRSWTSGALLLSVEAESVKVALEVAVQQGANLAGANLEGANLEGANLAGANLAWANLAWAELAWANLAGAKLAWAKLEGANLAGANLAGAKLEGANLEGAELAWAKLAGARPILQIGPLGSRCAYLVAFLTDKGILVRAGCWLGTLAEFALRVGAVHGATVHGREYLAAIHMIEAHAELWMPKKAEEKKEA